MWQDESVVNNTSVEKIERWIFYFLCGYALCSSVSIGGANVCLALATMAAVIRLVKKHDDWRELLTVDMGLRTPFFIFIGVLLVTNIFTMNMENTAQNMVQYYISNFEPFLLAMMFVRKKSELQRIVVFLVVSSLVNDVCCIYQRVVLNQDRPAGFLRIMSTAGLLSFSVPVMILLFISRGNGNKYLLWLALIVSICGAICNNTRGAWLAITITSVFMLMLCAKSKLNMMIMLLIFSLGIGTVLCNVPWMYQRIVSMSNVTDDGNNVERLYLWTSARNMASDCPLTGIGSGNFALRYREKYMLPEAKNPELTHAHNLFFQELAEHGYPGGVAFVVWVFGTMIYCVRGWHKEKNVGYVFILAIFMGLMLNGLTEHSFSHPIVMKLFWFGLGLSYKWTKIKDDETQSGAV